GGLFEVAGLYDGQTGGVDVAPEGGVDLLGRERRDLRFERDVPGEGALRERVQAEAADERAVLGARHAPPLEQGLLAGVDLRGAEARAHGARELLADRLLHARAVLRREDRRHAERRRFVERARAEAREGAVREALLLAHARRDARGGGA